MNGYIYVYIYINNKNDKSVSTNLIQAYTQNTLLNHTIITISVWQSQSINMWIFAIIRKNNRKQKNQLGVITKDWISHMTVFDSWLSSQSQNWWI